MTTTLKLFQERMRDSLALRFVNLKEQYDAAQRRPDTGAIGTLRLRHGAVMLQAPPGVGKTLIAVETVQAFSVHEKHLVRPLPKSDRPAGDDDEAGAAVFYVSGQQVKRCSGADWHETTAVVLATGGLPAIHFAQGSFSYSSDCWALAAASNVNPVYLWFWLLSKKRNIGEDGFRGAGIKHLDKDWLLNLTVRVPSLAEQTAIAERLQTTVNRLQAVVELNFRAIAELNTLRASIISEAVTGQILLPA